jgi:hypothetical protein
LPSWIRIRIRIPNTDPDPGFQLNTDPDPDPQPCYYVLLKVHLHHFSKIKSHKDVTKQYR